MNYMYVISLISVCVLILYTFFIVALLITGISTNSKPRYLNMYLLIYVALTIGTLILINI